jgi:two-component system OmpR family response regulator
MKVLVVEDDAKISAFIANGLREAGHVVEIAPDGVSGLALGSSGSHDAAVVDLMLPGLDGLAVIERWRASGLATPVLILSARRSVDDRVRGLRAGGDDYLVKPFSFSELLARIEALIRRSSRGAEPAALCLADLRLDRLSRTVTRGGQVIALQAREFGLLEYLLRNQGRVVSKTSILEVHRLRSKIDKGFEPKLLHTVRGMGYVLREG